MLHGRFAQVSAWIITGSITLVPLVAAAAAPPAAPADGSYTYVISRGGQKIGDSSVTVKRAATALSSHEVESFAGVPSSYTVDETFEPVTLTPSSYSESFPLIGQVVATARLAFDSQGARLTVDGASGSDYFHVERGTARIVVLDGALVTGFLLLPAQVRAQNLTSFTSLTVTPPGPVSLVMRVSGSSNASRPDGVPQSDASLSIMGQTAFTEWYDPQSMVVDEIDVPAQLVTIARTRAH